MNLADQKKVYKARKKAAKQQAANECSGLFVDKLSGFFEVLIKDDISAHSVRRIPVNEVDLTTKRPYGWPLDDDIFRSIREEREAIREGARVGSLSEVDDSEFREKAEPVLKNIRAWRVFSDRSIEHVGCEAPLRDSEEYRALSVALVELESLRLATRDIEGFNIDPTIAINTVRSALGRTDCE